MAAGVAISPNIRRESVRIDVNGNEIDPRTKQVIKPADSGYVPSKQEFQAATEKPVKTVEEIQKDKQELKELSTPPVAPNPLADIIKSKVNEAVLDAMKNIDIGKMVKDAVDNAFK
jgi:hypothetical protein